MDNVYKLNGFESRADYLKTLCEEFDPSLVYALAGILGEEEDFDGLVTSLEDYS